MIFTIHPEHGVKQVSVTLWDAENNKELCTFVDGVFETDDKAVIEKLIAIGYIPNPDEEDRTEANDTAVKEEELRAKAKSLGIKSWHVKSVETLEKEITEITER